MTPRDFLALMCDDVGQHLDALSATLAVRRIRGDYPDVPLRRAASMLRKEIALCVLEDIHFDLLGNVAQSVAYRLFRDESPGSVTGRTMAWLSRQPETNGKAYQISSRSWWMGWHTGLESEAGRAMRLQAQQMLNDFLHAMRQRSI